ncbi:MAG TPA: MarR family transcriptional regulator [Steroidobacteraceae bacterium]|nr:MarR family transcriptional regulator [Steroidobacteraceae bacterium]
MRTNLGPLEPVWKLGGADYLPLKLLWVAKLIDLHVARLLAQESGLAVAEWRVVAQLGVLHNGSVREMARQACVDPAEVSRSVASLEKRGFVERHVNTRDRRSPRFSLTPAGKTHLAGFRPHWRRFQKALAAKLTPAERDLTEHALTVIAGACLDLLEDY